MPMRDAFAPVQSRFSGCPVILDRLARPFLVALPLVFAACGGESLTLPDEGEPANIEVLEGDGQSGRVGSVLAESLVVYVTDTRDRPVASAEVVFDFTEEGTGGAASPATTTTDADGRAAASLVLGTRVGQITGNASVPVPAGVTPVAATFTATALSDDANGITLVSGNDQVGIVGSTLELPLVVQVTDGFGNPIQGVTIEWSAAGGGTVSEVTTVTGPDGQASVGRTLGATAGQQTTLATATGLAGSPVTFIHTAIAGTATGVVKISGDGQSGTPGAVLPQPLVVQVLDATGNPIPNRAVTWVIGDGGGSVTPETSNTDAQGNASTQLTLGPGVGSNTVNAVVSGVGTATFTATATAGLPSASTSTVSASPTSVTVGGSSTITVTVRDASNNPVSGASVTVASSGTGNTITPASASSGANGVATFTFSSIVAEAKTITATAGGVTIADQAAITVGKTSSTIEITEEGADPSAVGVPIPVEFTVTGSGGTPTGTVVVTLSGGDETCQTTLSAGAGSCDLTPTAAGPAGSNNRRVITATYGGDAQFTGDTDTENHRVTPAPQPNQAPTAAFTAPTGCIAGQPCQFTDASTDSDGSIASRSWTFPDGTPATSTAANPSVTFATAGTKTVTLTVTDDDDATNTVSHDVSVGPAPPSNTPPNAVDNLYLSASDQILSITEPSQGVLANDTDDGRPAGLVARNASDPANGTVVLNTDGTFTYTPDGFNMGSDTFTYEAYDGELSSTATVTITFTGLRLE